MEAVAGAPGSLDTGSLSHKTEARRQYERCGYVHLPQALISTEVAQIESLLDHLVERLSFAGQMPTEHMEADHTVRVRNAIAQEPGFANLIDHAAILPHLVDLLGPYLYLVASEVFVRSPRSTPMIRFHTDGGPAMQQISVDPSGQALSAKVQFFLTDLSEPDSGNLMVVDGSHRQRPAARDPHCWVQEANVLLDQGQPPPNSRQILAKPGDAVIFPYSLWHAVAPNRSGRTRKSVILRYGQLWHRPFDHTTHPAALLDQLTARQRRIVGDLGTQSRSKDFYKPADQLRILAGPDGFK